jgi:hypothetical protein
MHLPEIHVQMIDDPLRYSAAQIERALLVAHALNRGRLVLTERPAR